jgi:hypothetical protein
VGEGDDVVEQRGEVVGGEAVLGLLVGELDLDVDGEVLVEGEGGGVEAGGELERVDGVDGVEELGGAVGLVVLEGADEVDLEIGQVIEGLGLLLELLNAVFAEEAVAGGVGLEQGGDGVELADGHQGDVGWGPVGAAAGLGDLVVEEGEICFNGHSCCILSL